MTTPKARRATLLSTSCAAMFLIAFHVPGCGVDETTPNGAAAADATADSTTTTATTCASPLVPCGASCVDPRSDPSNCGACGTACKDGLVCSAGACVAVCPSSQVKCDVSGQARCVSTDTDRANCGGCGKACASGEVCSGGVCALSCASSYSVCSGAPYVPPAPDAGELDASDDASDDASADAAMPDASGPLTPYCANLQTDEDNCGVCGLACDYGTKCSRGLCCGPGLENCGGGCINSKRDPNNCGGCGVVCPNDKPFCGGGKCSSLYQFSGVKNDVAIDDLAGWNQCYVDTFDNNDVALAAHIQAACTGTHILVACREKGSGTLRVAAEAPRADVFFDTGTSNVTHAANGTGWYFSSTYSMGFAAEGDPVDRGECDTSSGPNDNLRLCFHTLDDYGAGYRCGAVQDLNDSSEYERILFDATE